MDRDQTQRNATISEQILEFPSSVRLEIPKPWKQRRFRLQSTSESVSTGVWCVPGFGAGFEIALEPSDLQKEGENPGKGHFYFLRQTLVCTKPWFKRDLSTCRTAIPSVRWDPFSFRKRHLHGPTRELIMRHPGRSDATYDNLSDSHEYGEDFVTRAPYAMGLTCQPKCAQSSDLQVPVAPKRFE